MVIQGRHGTCGRPGHMRTIDQLIDAVQAEAERAAFPVDTPVYERSEKDPHRPILFAGSLKAPVCVFARDLGKDEVARRVGAAVRRVIVEERVLTRDLGGQATTAGFTDAVVAALGSGTLAAAAAGGGGANEFA